ncbi:MAG: methyl-accepting chemotaxis protein [Marinobacter sp.]|uniref:methyl-accepting chemotaxis protein n=1 Tax=Marinobacter sp. TaxID=50741 RepID=UPI00299DECB5|nr:methyl-accepting chemotaxis protein [Marinobacter sp.]MDX1633590.1 methyl-accepting chemotaxis protein [Marinobacter sp.]
MERQSPEGILMRRNLPVTDKEVTYPSELHLITTTDLDSRITAVNEDFLKVSGFSRDELIGEYHNLIRHPDMPEAAFADLWATLKRGESWKGLVKNRCKNGDYYWVDAFVTPIYQNGTVVEYQSVRTCPERDQIARADKVYRAWRSGSRARRLEVRQRTLGTALAMIFTGVVGTSLAITWSIQTLTALAALVLVGLAGCAAALRLINPLVRLVNNLRQHTDPAMPFIYTGRRDQTAWLAFESQKKDSILRAISARMHSNAGSMQNSKSRTLECVASSVSSIRHQQDDLQAITQAFAELGQSVERVSELTTRTHDAANTIRASASQCRQRMTETSGGIEALATQLRDANTRIRDRAAKNEAIGVVVEVISGIAEQTNLLALNAAIEAARAGEHGRGFAVVADEVRALARRTHDSTQEITNIVASLQDDTAEVVKQIDAAVATSEHTRQVTAETAAALDATLADIAVVAECSQEVAGATEEQSALSLQVERQARNLLALGDRSVTSSEQARQESETLSQNVDQAHLLASHFLTMLGRQPALPAPITATSQRA